MNLSYWEIKTWLSNIDYTLIEKRINGLKLLRETLGDKVIDYKNLGGYELFLESDQKLYDRCINNQSRINTLLKPIFKANVFSFIQIA